ncbi:MAG: hypothetical protein J2P17_21460, partial [Mycobacterium sp.]|nr:hypothetical protein [Mycobacterium sp.]
MAIPYGTFTELDQSDRPLLNDALNFVRSVEVDEVLAAMVPRLTVQQREAVGAHAVVAHVAVLLFPDSVEALVAELRESGLHVDMPVPSVVVSERLARRYGLAVESLPVTILHVRQNNSDTVAVEIFALPAASDHIAVRERAERNESHLALQLDTTDDVLIEGVHALLTGPGNLLPDGGGYNAFEDCTALYYRYPSGEISAIPYKRLELRVRGRVAVPNAGHDPAIRLLELMTGAWTTQAIAVAVEIGLIDCLSGPRIPVETKSIGTLAKRLGVDPDALTRLLRYLASIGVLAPAGDSYTLTEIGELLRHEAPGSLRPLALLYGGPFYQSFGALEHAVRTGREGFERLFGKGHFDYFAEHAELGELFNAGMAASAPMFEPVPGLVDVSDARVVVDIGGGTAELLSRFLTQAP